MEEIEVKFLDIDLAKIEAKLKEIGAEKTGEYFYKRRVFDFPDWRLDNDHSWLRLRTDGKKTTLTFKKRIGPKKDGGNDDGMEEIEIEVDDFEKTAALIMKLGFVEKHYVENKRTRWEKDGVEFDIDSWPNIPPYLEIEAKTWEKVDEAIVWLELNSADKKIFSTHQVYKIHGINVDDYLVMTFETKIEKSNNH
ncbi:MAG: class IV adenylate cyclase [bacterium]|nr:class IV adenylate cyclase [bacterium]